MRKVCVKLVPKNLTLEQKDNRTEVCRDLLARNENGPDFLRNVITGDESWIFEKQNAGVRSGTHQTHRVPKSRNVQIQNQNRVHLFL